MLLSITKSQAIANTIVANFSFTTAMICAVEPNRNMVYLILIAITVFIIIGITLGVKKIIIVYNDFLDVFLSFMIFILPLFAIFILSGSSIVYIVLLGIIEIILIVILLYRTSIANMNIFKTLYALIIKTTLPLLIILLYALVPSKKDIANAESTKKRIELEQNKTFFLMLIGALSVVVFNLLKSRQWSHPLLQIDIISLDVNQDKLTEIRTKHLKNKKIYLYSYLSFGVLLVSMWVYLSINMQDEITQNKDNVEQKTDTIADNNDSKTLTKDIKKASVSNKDNEQNNNSEEYDNSNREEASSLTNGKLINLIDSYGDKFTYEGDINNGKANGKGKSIYNNGDLSFGNYVNGKREGYSEYHFNTSGKKYFGNFHNDRINGKGKMIDANGDIIHDGLWENDKPLN